MYATFLPATGLSVLTVTDVAAVLVDATASDFAEAEDDPEPEPPPDPQAESPAIIAVASTVARTYFKVFVFIVLLLRYTLANSHSFSSISQYSVIFVFLLYGLALMLFPTTVI